MSYEDKTLSCSDCGAGFTFTAGEQEFHATKGFTNEPKRCPDCRRTRKESRGDFRSGGGGGGGGGGGSREMFTAECAACGNEARVPFEPTPGRPVYCRDCFEQQRYSSPQRGGGGGSRGYR